MNESRNSAVAKIAGQVIDSFIRKEAPGNLASRINLELDERGISPVTSAELVGLIIYESLPSGVTEAQLNSLEIYLQVQWHRFIRMDLAAWSKTEPNTDERALEVLVKFGFTEEESKALSVKIPGPFPPAAGIYEGKRKNWYTPDVQARATFYWDSYYAELQKRPWIKADALIKLDEATTRIVSQLEDPTDPDFPTRGLVIGHVQSGKTQNFAGVIAKSIDAGYRLVIVLSGNTDILRKQTQRRLDMEIVGVSNILNGITEEENPAAYRSNDYVSAGNPNFPDKFIQHDEEYFKSNRAPRIRRRTDSKRDFAGAILGVAGLAGNDFDYGSERTAEQLPITDWANLKNLNVRFIVVKKQKDNLLKLIAEIHDNRTATEKQILGQIPTLVIDDESDQASINTKRPTAALTQEEKEVDIERTAINKAIVGLLSKLPRAQYVAYTATPFANVLVNPDDEDDLFPSQFVLPLDTPEGYMGASQFHDLEELTEEERDNPAISNKRAHIREFESEVDDEVKYDALKQAIDDFVISGSLKLWRQAKFGTLSVEHHTMLVHISHLKEIANSLSGTINESLWPELAYQSKTGMNRLKERYTTDFEVVSKASPPTSLGELQITANNEHLPSDFEELVPFIEVAIDKIESGGNPSMVVNSDRNTVAFDTVPTWKILVGGNLLSRGFTVEGLTVSFYLRTARTQDTLMQMGRWFGYRIGYEDIVRVHLPRAVVWKKATATKPAQYVNLNDLFTRTAIVEEAFREQVRIYGQVSPEDGISRITPRDLLPLIYQSAPELMPVAKEKMHYAEIAYSGQGGKGYDLHNTAPKEANKNAENFELVRGLYEKSLQVNELNLVGIRQSKPSVQVGRLMTATNQQILEILEKFNFEDSFRRDPHIALIEKAIEEGGLEDWLVYLPKFPQRYYKTLGDLSIPILEKKRSDSNGAFSRSNEFQRSIIEQISGRPGAITEDLIAEHAAQNPTPDKTGALLLTFTRDMTEIEGSTLVGEVDSLDEVATLFTYALPYKWSPKGQIGWRAKTTKQPLAAGEGPFKVDIA